MCGPLLRLAKFHAFLLTEFLKAPPQIGKSDSAALLQNLNRNRHLKASDAHALLIGLKIEIPAPLKNPVASVRMHRREPPCGFLRGAGISIFKPIKSACASDAFRCLLRLRFCRRAALSDVPIWGGALRNSVRRNQRKWSLAAKSRARILGQNAGTAKPPAQYYAPRDLSHTHRHP